MTLSAPAQYRPPLKLKITGSQASISLTGAVGMAYEIQATTNLLNTNIWQGIAAANPPATNGIVVETNVLLRFRSSYRAVDRGTAPTNMVLIPSGKFDMGDNFAEGYLDERPPHTVFLDAFFMDKYEVTWVRWQEVYLWAVNHGYDFSVLGSSKGSNHPVQSISWHDAVKWCNARSEKEGRVPAYYTNASQTVVYRNDSLDLQNLHVKWKTGYRLPTEAEWERASRGGYTNRRFPWGNTISHTNANYASQTNEAYDISITRGYHPAYTNDWPYTSPVGAFAANGFGLHDMVGNVWEWCWDWYADTWYSQPGAVATNTPGPTSGTWRILRGGSFDNYADYSRTSFRNINLPDNYNTYLGFRTVLPVP